MKKKEKNSGGKSHGLQSEKLSLVPDDSTMHYSLLLFVPLNVFQSDFSSLKILKN